jgi:hypothetical protein
MFFRRGVAAIRSAALLMLTLCGCRVVCFVLRTMDEAWRGIMERVRQEPLMLSVVRPCPPLKPLPGGSLCGMARLPVAV